MEIQAFGSRSVSQSVSAFYQSATADSDCDSDSDSDSDTDEELLGYHSIFEV
jgi:hypothetical protein